tara:strand:+ start:1656 stop:2444 length:789 start_codon:yes stop_codon:yes gene_type:complete
VILDTYSANPIMKTVLLTHAVTKWSFAVVALAVSLLGLPESQKASVSRSVNHIFHTYFEFPRDQGIQLNKNRFVPNLSRVDPETAYYFNKISRYSEKRPFEKGPVFKWNKDIKMFLHGDVSKSNKKELVKVVIELNRLIYPLKIKLVEHASLANSFVFFGSIDQYNKSPLTESKLKHSYFGHFHIKTYQQEIREAHIYINTSQSSKDRQKHIIREEITQSLGLLNDSYDYPQSIFYQGFSETKSYTPLDKRLISLLYGTQSP